MIKHAMRAVLIMTAVSMLSACGGGKSDLNTADQTAAQTMFAQSLSPGAPLCSDIATIAAGPRHVVGLKSNGTVTAVGYDNRKQLNVSSWADMRAVAAGGEHTVGLKSDGTVTAVGNNDYKQLNVTGWSKIIAIAAANMHTIALKSDGTVTGFGYNYYHQMDFTQWQWSDIKAIAAGNKHTVGLKSDGTVTAIGDKAYDKTNVSGWTKTKIKAIAAGQYHTVGLYEDGTVVAVGLGTSGQLKVSEWKDIKAIAAGDMHTVGLRSDGTVTAVGDNNYHQLEVSSWSDIQAIAANANYTIGLKSDGTVVIAGTNSDVTLNASSLTDIMPVCDGTKDVIPPTTTGVPAGTLGNNGWYVSDVQMTLTAKDNDRGSGVKEIHYSIGGQETVVPGNSALVTIAGDGIHTVTFWAIDNAANVETPPQVASINIDKTAPTITATISPSPNANGWNNTDVTVKFNCSDSASGIASCPADIPITTEGAGQTIVETAVDKAGNSAKVEVKLNIDKTPPSISSLTVSPQILWPPNRGLVNVVLSGSIAESGSGIASTIITVTDEYGIYNTTALGLGSTVQLESWRRGTDSDGRLYTITAVTTDNAGNQSSPKSTTVIVPHDMGGGASQGQDDDDHIHGKDHHEHGHHDQHHKKGHDRDGHGDGRQHDNDRGSRH